MKYATRQKEEKEKAEVNLLLNAGESFKAQRLREMQGQHPKRHQSKVHKLQKGKASATTSKRNRPRIQTEPRCYAETGFEGVLKPGSQSACAAGCSCPIGENYFGIGYLQKPTLFVIHSGCLIHGFTKINFDKLPVE